MKKIYFFLFFFPLVAFGKNAFTPKGITAIWDASTAAGIQNGAGTWDSTSSDFTYESGAANSPFCPGCNVSIAPTGSTGPAGTITVTGTQRINSFLTGTGGSGNYTITGGSILCVNSTPCNYSINRDATISSIITGNLGIIKSGSQTLTLSGANTYSGGTTISAGTLRTSVNTGAGTGTITLGDASTGANNTSWLFQGGGTPANNIIVQNLGTGTVTLGTYSAGLSTIASGTVSLNKPITISDGTNDRTTFNGRISGNVGTITVTGTSSTRRVTFGNSTNDFVGDISVSTGSIFQSDTATALPTTTNMILNGTGVYRLNNGGTHTINSLTGPSTSAVNIIAGGNATISLGNNNGGGTFSGVISDGSAVLSVIKNGTGTQTLSGNNTYTGTTTVNGGVLQLLSLDNFTSNITINAGDTLNIVDSVFVDHSTFYSGAIINNGVLNLDRNLAGGAVRKAIIGNAVSGSGTMNVNNTANTPGTTDGGWITFRGNTGSFSGTGSVNVNSGVLSRDFTQVDTINSTADFTIAAGAAFGAGRGGNSTIGGLFGAGDVGTLWSSVGSITFGNGNRDGNFTGIIRGSIPGGGDQTLDGGTTNVIKIGTGTQILTGANTYIGTTTINGGLLGGTGSVVSSAVTVGGAGTIFGGTGLGSSGTFTVGSLTFASSTSAVNVYSSGTGASRIVSNGNCANNTQRINVMENLPAGDKIILECASMSGNNPGLGTGTLPPGESVFRSLNDIVIGIPNTLDTVNTIPSGAYSMVKLYASYTGNAIRVRRSNDNATADIGFLANGDMDVDALRGFVGGNSGFVNIWYDQSGRGRNAIQNTAAAQPLIINNGALITSSRGGIPSMNFNGARFLDTGVSVQTMTNAGADGTVFAIINANNASNWNFGATIGNDRWSVHLSWTDGTLYFDAGAVSGSRVQANNSANNGNWRRYSLIRTSNTAIIRWSGAQRASAGATVRTTATTNFFIGGASPTGRMWGNMSEAIIYNFGVTGGTLTNIENHQANYWGVP